MKNTQDITSSILKSSQMNQIENHLFKLQSILKTCQKIKDIHDIDVYDMFGLYFYNDDKIEYNEKKCHALISKHSTAESLIQCSKPRCKNDSSKKHHLYCQQHFKIASIGELEMCIVCPDISKKLQLEELVLKPVPTSIPTPTPIPTPIPMPTSRPTSTPTSTTTSTPTSRRLRYIEIDYKVYYVDQRNLTLYDMDMCEIGKYSYDPETEQHIICEI